MTPERFWARCERVGECLVWTGASFGQGYGHFVHQGRHIRCHVYAYELANGPVPAGLVVCHKCDNPPCCEPTHLFAGTRSDNTRDAVAKGRWHGGAHSAGENHYSTHLSEDAVREIRDLREMGYLLREIGEVYGLTYQAVHDIVKRRNWRHVS